MKKTLIVKLLFVISLAFIFDANACGDTETQISGEPLIDYNKEYNYTMSMSAGYKGSSGGYTDTRWSIEGIGIVGYGEILTLNTTGWIYPEGDYVLKGENQFAGGCYGCISNTVFTLNIELKDLKPDLRVTTTSFNSATPLEFNEKSSFLISVIVLNSGTDDSPPSTVKIYWGRGSNQLTFVGGTTTVESILKNQSVTISDVPVTAPTLNQNEAWAFFYCNLVVDPDNFIPETNESNNRSDSYLLRINDSGQSIVSDDSEPELFANDNLIEIKDTSGNIIWKKDKEQFDYSSLDEGLYIFTYRKNNKTETKLILKKVG